MFNQINAYRQTCGFPAVQQNTLLDQATQKHAQYMVLNGDQGSDVEASGNPGFTGVDYMARAISAGWPQSVGVGGGWAGWFANGSGIVANEQLGQMLVGFWSTAVYHQFLVAGVPVNFVGLGVAQTSSNAYQQIALASESVAINGASISQSSSPMTFPCQGVTGIPYKVQGEVPQPPGASSSGYGPSIAVMGNIGDQITLTQASIIDTTNGQVIPMNVLDSATDPNKELTPYNAAAYPVAPLSPNTSYEVNLSGAVNGQPFSRSFTFTTGNVAI
jgi:hypothetical protein